MQQERWQRIDEIFHSALQVEGERRAAFLDQTCSGDTELRIQVQRLLRHHNEADSFLEQPAVELAAHAGRKLVQHEPMQGEIVAHYRVGAKLGSGGMGVVYEAEDLKLGRRVALKFLYDELEPDNQAIDRLQAEARAASRLNHPNICTIYAIEEHRGQRVMVMELLEGESLTQRVKAKTISTEELIRIAVQACDALTAAHAKGIVHRDIKPANIFRYKRRQAEAARLRSSKVDAASPSRKDTGEPLRARFCICRPSSCEERRSMGGAMFSRWA